MREGGTSDVGMMIVAAEAGGSGSSCVVDGFVSV